MASARMAAPPALLVAPGAKQLALITREAEQPSSSSSGLCERHRWAAPRYAPYARPRGAESLSCAASESAAALTAQPTAADGIAAAAQLQQAWNATRAQPQSAVQQRRSAYLDTAIGLACQSLGATMASLQAACSLPPDCAAAADVLDQAEQEMADTIRRTKLAMQLGAAIMRAEQLRAAGVACAPQAPAGCHTDADGEEVTSCWQPAST
ncbi:hypothetical protein HT031_004431 [Scenedesmus sp. PABB004]|nr:hypothetical protein HT031_004431 [Scenedesmus sp. PABB004]